MRSRNAWLAFACSIYAVLGSSNASADTAEEVRVWYESQYAPHFVTLQNINANRIVDFYTSAFQNHPLSASPITIINSVESWNGWKQSLASAGWTGGTVRSVDVETLNERTAVIVAHWDNRYQSESPSRTVLQSCNWYLATKDADRWRITSHVELPCN